MSIKLTKKVWNFSTLLRKYVKQHVIYLRFKSTIFLKHKSRKDKNIIRFTTHFNLFCRADFRFSISSIDKPVNLAINSEDKLASNIRLAVSI